MRTAFPVQELPARSALTVGVRCVNRTRKHAASVTAYSVLRACPSIQRSTPKLHQQTTGSVESERGLRIRVPRNGLLVRLPFQFHFLHLFICHRHCIRRLPRFAPIEVLFRMVDS
jgi:hypothetical protein